MGEPSGVEWETACREKLPPDKLEEIKARAFALAAERDLIVRDIEAHEARFG